MRAAVWQQENSVHRTMAHHHHCHIVHVYNFHINFVDIFGVESFVWPFWAILNRVTETDFPISLCLFLSPYVYGVKSSRFGYILSLVLELFIVMHNLASSSASQNKIFISNFQTRVSIGPFFPATLSLQTTFLSWLILFSCIVNTVKFCKSTSVFRYLMVCMYTFCIYRTMFVGCCA